MKCQTCGQEIKAKTYTHEVILRDGRKVRFETAQEAAEYRKRAKL